MNKKKPIYQSIIEITVFIITGFVFIGTILDSISNALSLLNFKISFIISITILFIWIVISYYIKKYPIKWLLKNGTVIKIKKLNHKIKFGLLGIIILFWIPSIFHKNINQNIENINYQVFEKNSSFNILLLPFGSSQSCNEETILCERELKKSLLKFKDNDTLNIDVVIDYTIQSKDKLYNKSDLKKICENTKADIVIWGDYNQKCSWDTSIVQVNYFIAESENSILYPLSKYNISEYEKIAGINEISNGKVYGDITNICFWILGLKAMNQNNFDNALNYLNKIKYKENKDFAQLFHSIALCYQNNLNLIKSIEIYSKAIKLDSSSYLSYNNRGNIYVNLRDFKKALNDFDTVIKYTKDNYPDVFLNKGILYRDSGEISLAINDFNTALVKWKKYPKKDLFILISVNRGITICMNGSKKGLEDIERALKADNKSEIAITGSIICNFILKDYSAALEKIERLLLINPKSKEAYLYRIKINEKFGNIQKISHDKRILKELIGLKKQNEIEYMIYTFGHIVTIKI